MTREGQVTMYHADPRLAELAAWLGDDVRAADFPQAVIRLRNQEAAASIGLDGLGDDEWIRHFARFEPLPGNLPAPLALRYHGHQFGVYNPELGDGRGFTFAQVRDRAGRLMDLGTKGSGRTPWSRTADGRLTLKGAVREALATAMLAAQGVDTSRTLSVIETGEALVRGDEPSPTRSAVLVRLSHGHIRIGTFQRLAYLGLGDEMAALVDYCLEAFPGPASPVDVPEPDNKAARLLHQVVERLADLAASYMVSGFVHGVLNTDNMNVSGESFDYGPWRWLPRWDPRFVAAYFDEAGRYAFGRQPEVIHWNCGQLAVALRTLSEAPPLVAALERFGPLYEAALARRWCARLGVVSRGIEADGALVAACERVMRLGQESPEWTFFRHRGGRGPFGADEAAQALAATLATCEPVPGALDHDYWSGPGPETMLIEEVEAIWAQIAAADDWSAFTAKLAALAVAGKAQGPPPVPAGHAA